MYESLSFGRKDAVKKPENFFDKLKSAMRRIAEKCNPHIEGGFVADDGTIRMTRKHFPDYEDKDFKDDQNFVKASKILWSFADKPAARQSFAERKRLTHLNEEQLTAAMLADYEKKKEKGVQIEMLVTILLTKALGDDYIIVRSCEYDDFENGVDNLIVNRLTGEVIGALDDTHDDDLGSGTQTKLDKITKKALAPKGGAKVKYGLTYKNGQLYKGKLEKLPIFFFSFNTDAMNDALSSLDFTNLDSLNEKETLIFNGMVDQLSEQAAFLLEKDIPDQVFKENLLQAQKTIAGWRK